MWDQVEIDKPFTDLCFFKMNKLRFWCLKEAERRQIRDMGWVEVPVEVYWEGQVLEECATNLSQISESKLEETMPFKCQISFILKKSLEERAILINHQNLERQKQATNMSLGTKK